MVDDTPWTVNAEALQEEMKSVSITQEEMDQGWFVRNGTRYERWKSFGQQMTFIPVRREDGDPSEA